MRLVASSLLVAIAITSASCRSRNTEDDRLALLAQDKERSAPSGTTRELTPARVAVSESGDVGYTAGTYRSSSAGVTETGKYVVVWQREDVEKSWQIVEEIYHADVVETPAAPRVLLPAAEMAWVEAPYDLPPGAKASVLSGDLTRPGPFVMRVQVPPGYRIPPHWHQGDINLTVLSGILGVGLGETWDNAALQPLMTGGFLSFPAGTRYFLIAEAPTLIQLHGTGPFSITYR